MFVSLSQLFGPKVCAAAGQGAPLQARRWPQGAQAPQTGRSRAWGWESSWLRPQGKSEEQGKGQSRQQAHKNWLS